LDQVAGSFDLSVTERWPGQDIPRPIKPYMPCRVLVDLEPVITGYVDDVEPEYDDKDHTIHVAGRDKTADLVDCSAPSTQFAGRRLRQVAATLCKPYGIEVVSECSCGKAFKMLKNTEGDSVFETLEAAARCRAVLLVTDGRGRLVITRAGLGKRVGPALELGKNVKRCKATFTGRDRYSVYTIKGQSTGLEGWGAGAAHAKAKAKDPRVPRHRPLTIIAESQADGAKPKDRALWEASVRYGRSRRITYTVLGWRHSQGLWAPGQLVPVRDSWLNVDEILLLTNVAYIFDDQGYRAELTVQPVESFKRIALPESKKGLNWP